VVVARPFPQAPVAQALGGGCSRRRQNKKVIKDKNHVDRYLACGGNPSCAASKRA
jgi:hypothetical protein